MREIEVLQKVLPFEIRPSERMFKHHKATESPKIKTIFFKIEKTELNFQLLLDF